jgi:methylglutaconyl-CoA hydratase
MKLEKSSCRLVIMNAAGKDFCAGLDLQQATDETLIEKMGKQLANLFTILHDTPLVTIACLHGNAIAGGGGIAASCDIVLMTEDAKIGFPETRRGLIAAQVAVILSKQMNTRAVKELLLTGILVDSYRAVEMGLANLVVIQDDIEKEAVTIAREILKGAPGAVKETKRLLDCLSNGNFTESLELALTFHHAARNSPEGKEGIAAFLEKRSPRWE